MQGKLVSVMLILGLMAAGCGHASKPEAEGPDLLRAEGNKILAAAYDSGFEHSHDTYNGLSFASDGQSLLCA